MALIEPGLRLALRREWITTDRDYARFASLQWLRLILTVRLAGTETPPAFARGNHGSGSMCCGLARRAV